MKLQSLTLYSTKPEFVYIVAKVSLRSFSYHSDAPRPNSREIRRHFTYKKQTNFLRFRTLLFECTNFSSIDPKAKNFWFNTVDLNSRYKENSMSNILLLLDPYGHITFFK